MKSLLFILSVFLFSCSVKSTGQKYAVREVKHLTGNAFLVKTDSFTTVRFTRGIEKYRPDSIVKSKK